MNMELNEKISNYKNLQACENIRMEDFYETLEDAGDIKFQYHEYASQKDGGINCEEELKRLQNADYDICCALMTMLLREDHFCNGSFEKRYRKGQVSPILDRMIKLLENRVSGVKVRIDCMRRDITKVNDVSAIVNAANNSLLGGGGVDGAIHRAAGRELLEECRTLHGCETGQAKITKAYHLPCRYVIHTVGPIWRGGDCNEGRLLEDCYRNSLEAAASHELRSVAFPSISTGVYSFPLEKAAKIAAATVDKYLEEHKGVFDRVTWVLFDERTKQIYETEIDHLIK